MKKKILSLVLAVVLLLGCLPMAASAASAEAFVTKVIGRSLDNADSTTREAIKSKLHNVLFTAGYRPDTNKIDTTSFGSSDSTESQSYVNGFWPAKNSGSYVNYIIDAKLGYIQLQTSCKGCHAYMQFIIKYVHGKSFKYTSAAGSKADFINKIHQFADPGEGIRIEGAPHSIVFLGEKEDQTGFYYADYSEGKAKKPTILVNFTSYDQFWNANGNKGPIYIADTNGTSYSKPTTTTGSGSGTTNPPSVTVTTGEATEITKTSAKLPAQAAGSIRPSKVGMYFGTSQTNMTNLGDEPTSGGSPWKYYYITSKKGKTLTAGATYYYRAYAIVNGETVWGNTKSFKTLPDTTFVEPTLKLSTYNISMYNGQTAALTATATPGYTIEWSSSNPSVATYSNGKITAKAPGSTTINATISYTNASGYGSAIFNTCSVTVKPYADIPGKPKVTVNGNTVTVSWSSAKNASSYEAYLLTKPWGWNDVKYSKKNLAGNVTSCTFTNVADADEYAAFVLACPYKSAQNQSPWTYFTVQPGKIKLNQSSLSMKAGDTENLTAATTPANQSVTWSSSDSSIATVNGGTITALRAGTVTITAKMSYQSKEVSASCSVTVTDGESPEVYTQTVTDVTGTSATLHGAAYFENGKIEEAGMYFGTSRNNLSLLGSNKTNGESAVTLKYTVGKNGQPLTEGTTYYFQAYAKAGGKEYRGEVVPFTTDFGDSKFADVKVGQYYYDAVTWAVEHDITSGVDSAHFGPNQGCTRAQAVTFLWKAAGRPSASGDSAGFSDVSSNAYYHDAVVWAVENGITSGTGNSKFSPEQKCTRAQIVTFLWKVNGSQAVEGNAFSDVGGSAYYHDAVAWAVENGITSGTGNNKFSPNDTCTRAQIVTFLYRDAE